MSARRPRTALLAAGLVAAAVGGIGFAFDGDPARRLSDTMALRTFSVPFRSATQVPVSGPHAGAHPQPWYGATIGRDDRTLLIAWLGGPGSGPCDVLIDHVEIDTAPRTVTVSMYSAQAGEAQLCTLVGYRKVTTIRLAEPLHERRIIDGADPRARRPVIHE